MALRRLTLKTRRNFFHRHRDWNRRWPDRWPQPPDVQLLLSCPIHDLFEGEWRELVTSPGVELVLELHPVQPQGMQESREALHDQKDGYRQNSEHGKNDEDPNESSPASRAKANVHHHCPEHFRQFCQTQEKHSQPRGLLGKCRLLSYSNPGSVHPTIRQLRSQVENMGIYTLGYLPTVIYSSFGGVSIKRTSVWWHIIHQWRWANHSYWQQHEGTSYAKEAKHKRIRVIRFNRYWIQIHILKP